MSAPAPFTSTPRAITAKWATGFSTVRGWIQAGIASIGVRAPERLASGGLTKKLIIWVCVAERARVAMKVPIPMPVSTQNAEASSRRARLPRNGTWKTTRATTRTRATMPMSRTKSGVILAATISTVVAGVIRSCSTVPVSFSRIIVAAATREPFSTMSVPRTPVTMNHAFTSPGL